MRLTNKTKQFFASLLRFPAEIIIAIVFYMIAVPYEPYWLALSFFGMNLSFFIRSIYLKLETVPQKILYSLPACLTISIPIFLEKDILGFFDTEIIAGSILFFLGSLLVHKEKSNKEFSERAITLLSGYPKAMAICATGALVIFINDVTLRWLFDISIDNNIYIFLVVVLMPILFFHFQLEKEKNESNILKIIHYYLFSPAFAILSVIIFCYCVKYFTWDPMLEMPDFGNEENYIYINDLFLVAFLGTTFNQHFNSKILDKFYKYAMFALILPLFTLIHTLYIDLKVNGLNEFFILEIMLIITSSIFIILNIINHPKSIYYTTFANVVLGAILVFMPFARATDIVAYWERPLLKNEPYYSWLIYSSVHTKDYPILDSIVTKYKKLRGDKPIESQTEEKQGKENGYCNSDNSHHTSEPSRGHNDENEEGNAVTTKLHYFRNSYVDIHLDDDYSLILAESPHEWVKNDTLFYKTKEETIRVYYWDLNEKLKRQLVLQDRGNEDEDDDEDDDDNDSYTSADRTTEGEYDPLLVAKNEHYRIILKSIKIVQYGEEELHVEDFRTHLVLRRKGDKTAKEKN